MPTLAVLIFLLSGCDSDTASVELTLANCAESATGVVAFYTNYFACSDISAATGGTRLSTDDLPPHPSAYYPSGDPNNVPFDTRGGTHHQIAGSAIGVNNFDMTVPDSPVPKGITIDAALIDNEMGSSVYEYPAGAAGMSLNGVVIFAAFAAGTMDLEDEQDTFDLYEAHPTPMPPTGGIYHYHFNTPGPLEVLVDRGYSSSSTPGVGDIELYGIMCDGTLVLGCTELDGSAPSDGDFDAQNGHLHDISDGTTTHFTDRYHTHVCPAQWPGYIFFPEIAYYDDCGI